MGRRALRRRCNDEGGNIVEVLAFLTLAPRGASLLQLALFRSREYEASVLSR